MNSSVQSNVQLWIRSEPLTYGILHVNPHPRLLSLHNIKKLVSYAKGKGKSGYPKLSYPIWKHIACNKLQISDNLAWMLFQTCIIMSSSNSSKLRNIECKLFSCNDPDDNERVKAAQSVELFKFVLFLYIQQINKISLRANAASPNAEWPEVRKSSDSDAWKSENKNMDESQHLQFFQQNISEILEVLTETSHHDSSSKSEVYLGQLSVDALNLIIEGRLDKSGNVMSFTDIMHTSSVNPTKIGYSKSSKTYDPKMLSSWLRSHLGSNPYGVEACIVNGKRLIWQAVSSTVPAAGGVGQGSRGTVATTPDDCNSASSSSAVGPMVGRHYMSGGPGGWGSAARRQKIATTANFIPKEAGFGNKLVLISSIYNQTIARSSGTLEHSTLKIHRCYYSYIYLLSPLRCVSIEKCRKTTICLGPVENTVQLINCEDCVILAACRRLVLIGCRRITLYCSTATSPLLCQVGTANSSNNGTSNTNGGGTCTPTNQGAQQSAASSSGGAGGSTGPNEDVCLAPLYSFYPQIEEHLASTHLDPKINFWSTPVSLGGSLADKCWEIMPASDFYPFTIPFEMEGRCRVCPYKLPAIYEEALKQRSQRYESLRNTIKNANLTSEQNRIFRSLVEQRFRQWLTESDEYRQLILLDPTTCGGVAATNGNNSNTGVNTPGYGGGGGSTTFHQGGDLSGERMANNSGSYDASGNLSSTDSTILIEHSSQIKY